MRQNSPTHSIKNTSRSRQRSGAPCEWPSVESVSVDEAASPENMLQ